MPCLLGDLPRRNAERYSDHPAVAFEAARLTYRQLEAGIEATASALASLGLQRGARVGVWLEKRFETVMAIFGAARAGCVFVPINPLFKAAQAAYIARDCNVEVLITNAPRVRISAASLAQCPDLRHVVLAGDEGQGPIGAAAPATIENAAREPREDEAQQPRLGGVNVSAWSTFLDAAAPTTRLPRVIDVDMAGILYTSGSTGKPKGVVLSHRNLVEGARSVSTYLGNTPEDRILAVLPLSFDYGLSQLTTSFLAGAEVVLHNYLFANDVVRALVRERITGLAAVPPLWIQLAALDWPVSIDEHLRYFTNSGGAMPTSTLADLRRRVPRAKPYLMYGLTEAFRSTWLPPEEIDRRPTSIGKAIPNAEVLVVREDGSECVPDEPGELVHRGALVSMGYWNDPEKTAERFRPLPNQRRELVLTETAVWSGDTVRKDEDGFLYFVGRRDEMIKTSGYRVSPTEIEEVAYRSGLVAEVAALGVDHPVLGQAIVLVAQPAEGRTPDAKALIAACKAELPAFMLPAHVDWLDAALPRNANGKIDRKSLAGERAALFVDAASN